LRGSLLGPGGEPIPGGVRLFHTHGWPIFEIWPDHLGNFQSRPLPDGTYYAVTVFTEGMRDEAWDNVPCVNQLCDLVNVGTPIVVDGADVEGLHFLLDPITSGGHISGTVSGPDGPLSNVGIEIRNTNGEFIHGRGTDGSGHYQTGLLADDTYYVVALAENYGLGGELWDNKPCEPSICGDPGFVRDHGTAIEITGGDRSDIHFDLSVPTGGLISGRTIDDGTRLPVPGVAMVLIDAGTGDFIKWTASNWNGDYFFSGLAAGDYKVLAEFVPEGYTPELYGDTHCHHPCNPAGIGAVVNIADDTSVVPGADIYLDFEGTRIVGQITRSDTSEPVNGGLGWIGVELFDANGDPLGFAHANEAGLYEFRLEGSGFYYLAAVNDAGQHHLINEVWDDKPCFEHCYPPEVPGAALVPVDGGETFVANFELDPGYRISGTLAFGGAPTPDSWVNIWDWDGQHVSRAGNHGDGNWESPILPAGTYYATAHGEDFGHASELWDDITCPWESCDKTLGDPVVLVDADVSGIEFDLAPQERSWRLRGSVRNGEGQPVGGAARLYNGVGGHMYEMWTDHEGNFESDLLTDGTYYVVTVFTGMLDEAWEDVPCVNQLCNPVLDATPIMVDGGDVDGLHIVLEPITSGGHIEGQVRGPDGPLANVWMDIRNANGDHVFGIPTDSGGYYRTGLLPDETYFVVAQNEQFGLLKEVWDDVQCVEDWHCGHPVFIRDQGTAIAISGADRTGIDFDLGLPPGGTISGQLIDAGTGLPVMGAGMALIEADTGHFVRWAGAGGNGVFHFAGLAAGDYKILAEWPPEGYMPELYGGEHWPCDLVSCGATVSIVDETSAVSGADILLDFEGTRIVGRITRSDTGEPVSGAQGHVGIDLFGVDGSFLGGWGANEAGLYDIRLEGNGEYYLLAVNDVERHQLINEVWLESPCVDHCYPPMVRGATTVAINEGGTFVANFELTALAPPVIERRADVRRSAVVGDGTVIEENVIVRWRVVIGSGVYIEKNAFIGPYCVIGHLVRIGQNAVLGRWCFIEEGAIIEKGAVLGEGVHVGLYSVVGKDAQIGDGVFIGANVMLGKSVVVHPGMCIPDGTVIPKDGVVDTSLCD
jgi:acetyltransferase-like isoleucine patch superfamily enzyme